MKKILIICSTLDAGGAAKIISNVTTHLPGDWEVDLLLNADDRIKFPYKGKIISLNIPEPKSRTSFRYQGQVFFTRLKKIVQLKRKGSYDACISFMDSANVINILTGNRHCEVIINIINNMSAQDINEPLYRWFINPLGKLLYNKADKIVALSEEVKADMIEHFGIQPQKLSVIYCSVDIADVESKMCFNITRDEEKWFSKDRTVVTAGRMEKQKGQWHLIRAFSKVVEQIPDAKLVIFGEGSLKEYFIGLIKDYHMEESVLLYGFNKNLDTYISKSAVFAFPSLYEGFGTALQEALACNIPCIATDYVSGAREQLAPDFQGEIKGYMNAEYGIIVERCSGEMTDSSIPLDRCEVGMADAIIDLLCSRQLRNYYAEKAKERSKIYDIGMISRHWVEMIEK